MGDNCYEIKSDQIAQYISSNRNCKIDQHGFIMDDRSLITLDFSSLNDVSYYTIEAKKISGNGNIVIESSSFNLVTKIASKISQSIDIGTSDRIVSFKRPEGAIGQIKICNITIRLDKMDDSADIPIENKNTEKWKEILKKCSPYSKVRIIDDRVFASEGGKISASNVEHIVTYPACSYSINSGFIKFIYPCEIFEIKLKDNSKVISTPPLYKHLNSPPVITTNSAVTSGYIPDTHYNAPSVVNILIEEAQTKRVEKNSVIYSSNNLNIGTFHNISGNISNAGSAVTLDRYGSFCVPISDIESYSEYVVVLKAHKNIGNGKLEASIVTSTGEVRDSKALCASNILTDLFFKIKSGHPTTKGYMLKIGRPVGSVGNIVLKNIKVIKSISQKPVMVCSISEFTHSGLHAYDNDIIARSAKAYSRQIVCDVKSEYSFRSSFNITTHSGMLWFNKIKSLCPNIEISKQADIVIGEIGSLAKADKICLEPFIDGTVINSSDNDILSNAKVIITPSFSNSQKLMEKYPKAEILHLERTIPDINGTSIKYFDNKHYMIYVDRHSEVTTSFLKVFEKINTNLQLVIIGARGNYPQYVIPVNEYISYDKFTYIFKKAKMLIDFPSNTDYTSALLSLAHNNGIPIVTSNWYGLYKNNVVFAAADYSINDIECPSETTMHDAILECLENNTVIERQYDHNKHLVHLLSVLTSSLP